MGSGWEAFKKNFPWKDMTLGLLIPKAIFLIGIRYDMLFAGGLLAVVWCLAVFWITQVRAGRVNIFAIAAVIMVIARIAVVLTSKSAALYLLTQAIDSALYGVVFLASLLLQYSAIQLFVEASGVKIPEAIRATPYYIGCWRIVTAVWGVSYLLLAIILVMVRSNNMSVVAIIDIFSGWPVTTALVVFTVIFPRRYWTKKLGVIPVL